MEKLGVRIVLLAVMCLNSAFSQVYFTTGIKIGEVTSSSVIIHTRLCASEKAVPIKHKRTHPPLCKPIDFNEDMPLEQMDGFVKGTLGQVKIDVIANDEVIETMWEYVSSYEDYTIKRKIEGLKPNTEYKLVISGRKNIDEPITKFYGRFKTMPEKDEITDVVFTTSTCQMFWTYDSDRGLKIYDEMAKLNPDFHVQTGDYVYYDKPGPYAKTVALARHKWHAINSFPSLIDFYARTPLYAEKDDHDLLKDDASPGISPYGELSYKDGVKIWYEQMPVIGKPYRTFKWGKDLQIWLVDVREFRSDNWENDGKEKTILGDAQKEWLKQTIKKSKATFKIIISPTPIVGPDRSKGKNDNHANKSWGVEGEWLRSFLSRNKVIVINGDRHWQYVSKDLKTNLLEFSVGSSSNEHAGGWKKSDKRKQHEFLRVEGGFMSVKISREKNNPKAIFQYYDVNGNIVHEKILESKSLK